MRAMHGLRRGGVVVAFAIALATTPPAVAQNDEGVFIDPDSPSGQEYDIPLEQARREVDPSREPGTDVARGSRSAEPFGEGIGTTSREAGSGAGRRSPGGGDSSPRERAREPRGERLPPEVAAAAARPLADGGGGGSTLLYGGFGALVVAVGALAGLWLRRRVVD